MKRNTMCLILAMILCVTLVGCNESIESNETERVYSVNLDNAVTRTTLIENNSGVMERHGTDTITLNGDLEIDSISILTSSFGEFPYESKEVEISKDYAEVVQDLFDEIKRDNFGGGGADVSYGHKAKIEILLSDYSYTLRLEFYIDNNEDFVELRVIYSDDQGYVETTTYTAGFETLFERLLDVE